LQGGDANSKKLLTAKAAKNTKKSDLGGRVLQHLQMSPTLTIRLSDELLAWLKETSRRTGILMGRFVREQLETAKSNTGKWRFIRHLGAIKGGPPDVSSRKGFSRAN
jgi:predicted DNA binding CopG/RHH family protein